MTHDAFYDTFLPATTTNINTNTIALLKLRIQLVFSRFVSYFDLSNWHLESTTDRKPPSLRSIKLVILKRKLSQITGQSWSTNDSMTFPFFLFFRQENVIVSERIDYLNLIL